MGKNILKQFYLFVFLWLGCIAINAQNMSRYITLTVQQGEQIKLDLRAESDNTPIKIVSGTNEQTITVGTRWTGAQNYTAGANTMTIYGDVIAFDCGSNQTKLSGIDVSHNIILNFLNCHNNNISSLDVSHNVALEDLYCYDNNISSLEVSSDNIALMYFSCEGNNLTTQAIDELMCKLPNHTGQGQGSIYLLGGSSDSDSTVLAANSTNATAKNWTVRYNPGGGEITGFTGTFDCASLSVEDIEVEDPTVTLYPNPVSDVLYVKADSKVEMITVYSMTGTIVKEVENADSIPMAHLPSATYIVKVKNAKGVMVKNVIKK